MWPTSFRLPCSQVSSLQAWRAAAGHGRSSKTLLCCRCCGGHSTCRGGLEVNGALNELPSCRHKGGF